MDFIDHYLSELETAIRRISRDDIRDVVDELMRAWRERRMIYVIGNGGSASTASHMMNDLTKCTIVTGMPRVRCVALTDNVPVMTAFGNDQDYADIFYEPLQSLLQSGDVLIAISASGNSPNIVKAVQYARTVGSTTIGLCGDQGGKLAELATLKILVPAAHIGQQEDGHLILNHVISYALRLKLQGEAAHLGAKGVQ